VRDHDLGCPIDSGLCIIAPDITVDGFQDAAVRISEDAMGFAVELASRRADVLPFFLPRRLSNL
jgi:hypothetical protein